VCRYVEWLLEVGKVVEGSDGGGTKEGVLKYDDAMTLATLPAVAELEY